MFKKIPLPYWILGILSLLIRLYYSELATFQRDEIVIYEKGLDLFLNGNLRTHGADIIYSGTKLPGSLLNLLTGIPLWLTEGLPTGNGYFLAIMNFSASVIVYRMYREIFPELNALALFMFTVFAPWSIFQAEVTNPNFLPFFSAFFFFGVWKLMKNPSDFIGAAFCSFAILSILQLHMSVMLLLALLFGVFLTGLSRISFRENQIPSFTGLTLGLSIGVLPLIPWFIDRMKKTDQAGEFVSGNIVFSPNHFEDFTRIYTRFVSFASGESARFFGRKGGMKRVVEVLNLEPWAWVPYLIATAATLVILFFGLRFFIIRGKWILKDEKFILNPGKLKNLTPIEKMDIVVWILPLMTYVSFLFSIKGPSAHAYWVLFPVAFHTVFRSIDLSKKKRFFQAKFVSAYVLTVMLSTIPLTRISPHVFSVSQTIEYAKEIKAVGGDLSSQLARAEMRFHNKDERLKHFNMGVKAVLHALNR